jgi:hypothetical protein
MRVALGEGKRNGEALQERGEQRSRKMLCEKTFEKKPMKKLQKKSYKREEEGKLCVFQRDRKTISERAV